MYSTGSYNYGTAAQTNAAAQSNSSVGFDTSSNDPELVKARVFVGNLNTTTITRDELIQLFRVYGTLTGVTLFKGFSFVQYAKEADAVLAVQALNGYNWNGSVLDVKLASQNRPGASSVTSTPASAGMKSSFGYGQKAAYDYGHAAGYGGGGAYGGGGYGGGYGAYAGGYGAYGGGGGGGYGGYAGRSGGNGGYFAGQKRSYPYGGGGGAGGTNFSTPTSGGGVNAEKVNADNKKFAAGVVTHPDIVDHHNASDFLVCGECRFVSSSIMAFIEHRKKPCTFFKAETEPAGRLQCFSCTDEFSNCWKLLQHLTTMHKLTLYKAAGGAEETAGDTSTADGAGGENGSGTGDVAHAGEQ